MKRVLLLVLLAVLAVTAIACSAPPTPTPKPSPTSVPPAATTAPSPTATRVLPTPTPAATATPTLPPTATPRPTITLPPTRAGTPVQPTPAVTAPPPPPPAKGVIVFHSLKDGVDKLYYVNVESGQVSDFEGKIGGGEMDFAESTNAHLVEFSPDSTKIAYVAGPPPGGAGSGDTLKVRDVKSGQERAVYSDKGISSPSWSPDSQRILFIRKAGNTWALTQVDADGKNAKDIFTNKSGEQFRGGLSWSKLNMIAFAMNTTGASDVHVMFPDAKEIKNVTSHAADDSNPSWSPDGKMVLFTSTRDGSAQIYRVNADGSGLHRLSTPAGVDFSPSWSPDGNWVAFASTRNNATNIFIMDIYGANVKQVTFNGVDSRPIWTR